jgi:hypothetical protein
MTMSYKDSSSFKVDGNGTFIVVAKENKDSMSSRILEAINLSNHQSTDNHEVYRTITSNGVVTKYFRDGTFVLLQPSGYLEESSKGDYYKATYPNGKKYLVQPKIGEKKLVERYPCQSALDPESGTIFTSRADGLMIFKFKDESRLTVFPDGTRIHSTKGKTVMTIEHPSHEKITIDVDYFRARNPSVIGVGSAFASKGRENLFERTYDGRIMTVHLSDGGRLRIYKEMRELEGYNNFRLVAVTLYDTANFVTLKIENYGEIVYLDKRDFYQQVPASTRLNTSLRVLEGRANKPADEIDQRKAEQSAVIGSVPFDHFIQLFMPVGERAGGVYTVDLNKGEMLIRDFESNEFKINKEAKLQSKISVSFNLNNQMPVWDEFPKFDGSEYLDPINLDLPVPKKWLYPTLAIVQRDGNAKLLHAEEMLEDYFHKKLLEPSFALERDNAALKSKDITIISHHTKHKDDLSWKEVLPSAFRGIPQTKGIEANPPYSSLAFRRFVHYNQLEKVDSKEIESSRQAVEAWQQLRDQEEKNWAIYASSAEEKAIELEFQQRMLVLAQQEKNILVYGQSNKAEISNAHNVVFADS